jgi:Right handed beta helix region
MKILKIINHLAILLCLTSTAFSQSLSPYAYDIGSPTLTDYYIDPVNGSDEANGTSTSTAWKTVQHAWGQIPNSTTLTTGYRFNLMNGNYGNDELPNYWELKTGTATAPIILTPASGQSTVKFVRDINMANVSYFYLIGLEITPAGGGDAFHCENCNNILVRGCILNGGSKTNGAHETVKINQSQYIYLENNNILYADDNNIDFVGVQYGHIIGNKIHEAADWCAYVKGGSAYIRIESNEFYNCGTGGFTVGQGSGFQFMTSPWLHYEAYDIKFINNIIHDTEGAAFGANGSYNVLMAHNTAYKVGTRDHLVEVVFGERTCDGETAGQANTTCASYNAAGGWGPSSVRTTPEPVGNRNISILNNIIYNPSGTTAPQHFAIYGPRNTSNDVNMTSPQVSDTNLIIKGNIIWNGSGATPLGIEDTSQGCQPSNTSCNQTQLQSQNSINSTEPQFKDPANSDFRPQSGSNILSATPTDLTSFAGGDKPASSIPDGVLSNTFARDLSGTEATGARIVGAYNSPDSSLTPPTIDGNVTPTNPTPGSGNAPTVSKQKLSAKKSGKKTSVTVSASVTSDSTISSVSATFAQGKKSLGTVTMKQKSGNTYSGKGKIKANTSKKVTATISATNSTGTTSKKKSATIR